MRLPPIAKKVQELLNGTPKGLLISELLEQIKAINPYIRVEELESNLARFKEIFTLQDDRWRLNSLIENEMRETEVNKQLHSKKHSIKKNKFQKNDYEYYTTLREGYIQTIDKELIGPKGGLDEIIEERPNVYYLGGMLYPSNVEVEDIQPQEQFSKNKEDTTESIQLSETQVEDDEEVETNQNRFHQSSMGLTCNVSPNLKNVKVLFTYGKYEEINKDKKKTFKRSHHSVTKNLSLNVKKKSIYLEDGNLEIMWLVKKKDSKAFLSIFLVNRYSSEGDLKVDDIIFQPSIKVTSTIEGEQPFLKRTHQLINEIADEDMARSNLLYRNRAEFAVGHGCAVEWGQYSSVSAGVIQTSFMPTYEIPAVEHLEIEDMEGLNMFVLAYITDGEELRDQLTPLVEQYRTWIEKQEQIYVPGHGKQKKKHINSCYEALDRIIAGIELVCKDSDSAFKAFKFANEMMLYQRLFSERAKHYRTTGEYKEDIKLSGRWRPFQLAFILLNIESIVDPSSEERELVDLLWFPTGGGKTEAYLGLASFVMALRRLNGVKHGIEGYAGTTVMMRYTLRLLTIQQFQRASALICAAEYLRSKDPSTWGNESFSIGLWVGGGTTPNQLEGEGSAKEALDKLQDGKKVYGGNPIQLHNCPSCGTDLTPEAYNVENTVFSIQCLNEKCFFNKNDIPAYTVDEAIYYKCPTILIGTVDKFARLPWTGKIAPIFGKVDRYCERHGFIREGDSHATKHNSTQRFSKSQTVEISKLLPPELIIQDELHLISGPLGSMVGLYETAVDFLSSGEENGKKIKPKVVASTATIRRAGEQISGLFNRDFRQFPPSGIDAEDSFFSYEITDGSVPGRKYVGMYFPGSSGKTSLVRIYASLLQKGNELKLQGENVDPYYTLAGYFNSLRELGGTLRLLEDDIPDRIKYLARQKGQRRIIKHKEELTSRIDATEIPSILNKLEQPADNPSVVDVLLATNMISVGVDIDRLGLMVVTGQPKGTSEYIQATSRVGRKFPGLVLTLYNWSRPRDISHYEQFISYHSKFYSYVEATSVTPFSYRARDKGLKAVVIGLLRQLDPRLFKNSNAKEFNSTNDYLKDIKEYIVKRCLEIDEIDSKYIEEEIDSIIDWWSMRVNEDPDNLSYQRFNFTKKDTPVLLKSINQSIKNASLTPDSLRDVEAEVEVYYTYLMDEED
jgi:Helicase conserved C-terminal domain